MKSGNLAVRGTLTNKSGIYTQKVLTLSYLVPCFFVIWPGKQPNAMQTTFQLDSSELNEQFIQRLRAFYAGHKVRITVEEEALSPSLQPSLATPTSTVPVAYQPPQTPVEAELKSLTNSLLFGRAG